MSRHSQRYILLYALFEHPKFEGMGSQQFAGLIDVTVTQLVGSYTQHSIHILLYSNVSQKST